jgi:hypothetical protein
MAAPLGKLALVPLLAVTIILGVSGVHGRNTHDPDRAKHALDILALTSDPLIAKDELHTFFETGWVNWDVKTAVEIACGTARGWNVADPVGCVGRAHGIVLVHEMNEERTYRTYTWLARSAVAPALVVIFLAGMQLAPSRRRKKA